MEKLKDNSRDTGLSNLVGEYRFLRWCRLGGEDKSGIPFQAC